jgi:hypothetical protein
MKKLIGMGGFLEFWATSKQELRTHAATTVEIGNTFRILILLSCLAFFLMATASIHVLCRANDDSLAPLSLYH